MTKLKLFLSVLLMGSSCITLPYFTGDKLWRGAIKFPGCTKNIPPVRVYYSGTIIPSTVHQIAKEVSFDIPESSVRNSFCMIIVDDVELVTEQNTVQYLRAPLNRPYKLYLLEFTPNKDCAVKSDGKADASQMGTWQASQKLLPDDNHIPDNTIIVCYHPLLVKDVEGGNGLELPKIVLDERILSQLTDEELQDASIHFLLTSLNCDTIHARQNALVKPDFAKKTIMSMIYA